MAKSSKTSRSSRRQPKAGPRARTASIANQIAAALGDSIIKDHGDVRSEAVAYAVLCCTAGI